MEQLFIQTINQNQGILHKVCRVYCYNTSEREDLFQEMVLQLWKAFPTFRNEAKISTWMYRIALNTAISRIRKKKIETIALENVAFQMEDKVEDNNEEELKYLYRAIEKLSDVEKSIVLLYMEDKPYDEIAEITGITANYVAVKMSRIKDKLKNLLKAYQ